MKRVVLALLTIGVVASIALNGAMASTHADARTTDMADIVGSPGEWVGQEVTVEGWVFATFYHWFVLSGDDGPSITVKCTGDTPTGGMVTRARVTGTVGIEELFGNEQAYVFARSWEYLN